MTGANGTVSNGRTSGGTAFGEIVPVTDVRVHAFQVPTDGPDGVGSGGFTSLAVKWSDAERYQVNGARR